MKGKKKKEGEDFLKDQGPELGKRKRYNTIQELYVFGGGGEEEGWSGGVME